MTGTIERAFELAPKCTSMEQLRNTLQREGHYAVDDHLRGSVRKQLTKLLNFRPGGNEGDETPNPLPDYPSDSDGEGGGDAGRSS